MDFTERLNTMIRARYPILAIITAEEMRARKVVDRIAEAQGKTVFYWSVSMGWTNSKDQPVTLPLPVKTEAEAKASQQMKGLSMENMAAVKAMQDILAMNNVVGVKNFYVLLDFLPATENQFVERCLRDCARKMPYTTNSTIMIISPTSQLKDGLNKDVVILDFELPDYDEINAKLEQVIEGLPEDVVIDITAEDREVLVKAALGLTLAEAENAFSKAVVQNKRLSRDDVSLILEEKKQIVRHSGTLEYFEADVKFESVGGMDLLKEWMRKRSGALTEEAKNFGLPTPKGVLLLGVQGSGKSMLAKTLGSLWEMPVLRFDVSSIYDRWMGSSEINMRKAIGVAESVSPTVLWLDEIEKGFSGMSGGEDGGTSARVLSYFLTWLQENKKAIFVVATCNDVQKLPPELLRKGRLDDIFFIDLPCQAEREEIFKIHIGLRHRNPDDFDLAKIASVATGFSGAEIEQVVISALYDAYDQKRDINTMDLLTNVEHQVPLSTTMAHKIQASREWASTRARPSSSRTAWDEEKEDIARVATAKARKGA